MLERANQPHAYIMADVERAERELGVANKRIKLLEEELKKSRKEVETLQIVRLIKDLCCIAKTWSKRGPAKADLQTLGD